MRFRVLLLLLAMLQIGAAPVPSAAPVAATMAAAPAPAPEVSQERRAHVSLIALIAQPERYDGRLVSVDGFLDIEYDPALYVTREDFDQALFSNAISVDGPEFEEKAARRALDERYVTVQGRFRAGPHGHLGTYAAGIENVSLIQRTYSRRVYRQLGRPDAYLLFLPWNVIPPWPLIVLGMLAATLAGLGLLRRRPSVAGRILAGLVPVFIVFSIVRIVGGAQAFWFLHRSSDEDWHIILNAGEVLFGLVGLIGMLIAWRLGRRTLCLIFCLVQLAFPIAIEAVRFGTWTTPVGLGLPWPEDNSWPEGARPS